MSEVITPLLFVVFMSLFIGANAAEPADVQPIVDIAWRLGPNLPEFRKGDVPRC